MTAGPALERRGRPGRAPASARPSVVGGGGPMPGEPGSSLRPSVLAAQAGGRPSEPWNQRVVLRLFEIVGGCAIALGVSWFGVSGTTDLARQLLWITLGIGAVAVAGFGQAMFVLEALRVLRARRLAVMEDVAVIVAEREARLGGPATVVLPTVAADDDWVRVASPSMRHYHRPGCQLAVGKATFLRGSADDHVAAGRSSCGVCAA